MGQRPCFGWWSALGREMLVIRPARNGRGPPGHVYCADNAAASAAHSAPEGTLRLRGHHLRFRGLEIRQESPGRFAAARRSPHP